MTDLNSTLAEMRARVDAATAGPWLAYAADSGQGIYANASPVAMSLRASDKGGPENATFIAHARTDLPALLAAVEAVVAVHVPYEGAYGRACSECVEGRDSDPAAWPCPTIRACPTRWEVGNE